MQEPTESKAHVTGGHLRAVVDISPEPVAPMGSGPGAAPNVTIRAAEASEVDACVALWVRACAERDGRAVAGVAERARAKFDRRTAWRVAESGERIVGFALATEPGSGAPSDPGGAAVLGLLAVDPVAQGLGLGRRMLAEISGALADAGFTEAVLHVLADNAAAVRLYERAGWRPHGEPFEHTLLHWLSQSYVIDLRGLAQASI
ncbi:GNAT family N-acetyltransferase [Gryllotalpicola protaetiae]|uniref:GNAT family N-acetyltransferase n=1 Tax=Gryllotalpicola protaetiae TaxID=2419771 RepID=UPI0013C45B9B|nr:GNAT family N-acetyltransferase [Gryllotalpicola protaetiae]